jgi:AcrR family transcriptional regulator
VGSEDDRGRSRGDAASGGRREETKRRLLAATEEVFGRLGFHEASIVEITESAGLGLGTFYVHFPSKTDAFRELVRHRRDELRQLAKDAAAKHTTHREMLRAAFGAFFEGIAAHRGAFRLIREAEFVDRSLVVELYETPAKDFQSGLEAAMEIGNLPTGDAEAIAWFATGMAEFTAMRWIVWGEDGLPAGMLDTFVEAMLRLVGSPEATALNPV